MWRDFVASKKPGRGVIIGGVIIVASLIWFYVATFIIVPANGAQVHHTTQSIYFNRYGALGNSPLDIIKNILTKPALVWSVVNEPARVQYLLGLLASFGFLSLLGLDVILLALPLLLANLLSAYPAQYYGDFHYTAPLVPYFAVAAIYGVHRILRFFRTTSLPTRLLLAVSLVWVLAWSGYVYVQAGRGPWGGEYEQVASTPHHQLLQRFLAQIPDDAPITATSALHPHLSHRRYIYRFPYGIETQPPAQPAQWALLDVTGDTDMAPGDLREQVLAMLAGDWGVVDAADGYLLLHRGAEEKTIPDAFYDFVRIPASPAAINQRYPVTFADISVEARPRWRQTKIITEWLVGSDFQAGTVRPWLELRAPSGELLYTFDQSSPPALTWYPPEQWQPGDRIRITTLPLYLPRYWGAGVGVVHGPDPFQPNDRLPAKDVAPAVDIRSIDGTLALPSAYQWGPDGKLHAIPQETLLAPDLGAQVLPDGVEMQVNFRTEAGDIIPLQAWLPTTPPPPGGLFDFWMRWEQGIPAGYQPFVHLRHSGQNIAQEDGPPKLFLPIPVEQGGNDWREFTIPAEVVQPGDEISLFVGLYNLQTGQRIDILGQDGKLAGNEIRLGNWAVAEPPVPDQTCALIPDTCLSQP
jgi:hypothetical protein